MDYKILKDHPWLKKDLIVSFGEINTIFSSVGIAKLIDEGFIEEISIIKTSDEIRKLIIGNVKDLISAFLYYDRKEDEDLQLGDIEKAIKDGLIKPIEIIDIFRDELLENLKE